LPRAQDAALPALFVGLWSTGFIFARLGLPYAQPFTFLAVRLAVAAALLLVIAVASGAAWPRDAREASHIAVTGLLFHGAYLAGVFEAIDHGVATGIVALIAGLQPILTAAIAGPLLGERIGRLQWAGFVLGFAGIALVVWDRYDAHEGTPAGFALAFLCLAGITAGTLYQKRFCSQHDLLAVTVHQYLPTVVLFGLVALLFETREVEWTVQFAAALLWLVLALSLGAILLLTFLIKHGEASKVASLFYLVPPVTAVMAWLLFDEPLGWVKVAGIALVALGVWLVMRQKPRDPAL
jgi:drug/metabolite transporter (DMT)-like permease